MARQISVNIGDVYLNHNIRENSQNIKIAEYLRGNDYYRNFLEMIRSLAADETYDFTESAYYKHCVSSEQQFQEVFLYRATVVKIMNDLGCSHETASVVCELYKKIQQTDSFVTDIGEAMTLIIRNYVNLLQKFKNRTEVALMIGILDEFGRVCIIEGIHRLMMHLACNIEKLEVTIIHRHERWLKFIKFFEEESLKLYKLPRLLYEAIDHPDFGEYSVIRDSRMGPIYENLVKIKPDLKTGLDTGCFIGGNSHYLARRRIKMYGIEYEMKYYDAAKILNKTYDLDVTFVHENVHEFVERTDLKFDFVIILSLAYHLYRDDRVKATAFLKRLFELAGIVVIDDEPRTKLFTETDIRRIYEGCDIDKIYTGTDDRSIYVVH